MIDVYEVCPSFEDDRFLLRMVCFDDCRDLLKVYSDENAVPFFNSDNCNGDDFHYTTPERMKSAMEFWLMSYKEHYFVRCSIVDKSSYTVIGTIELFHREADDYFTNCGLLRLDLRSDYETAGIIQSILSLIVPEAYELFDCSMVATKCIDLAAKRSTALHNLGFNRTDEKLIGHDGTKYGEYWIRGISYD